MAARFLFALRHPRAMRLARRLKPRRLEDGTIIYLASPTSRLSRLSHSAGAPYWAYLWAGGAALADYLASHPHLVQGQRVLDLGAGAGRVAILAAKLGARSVLAADTDRNAIAAIRLNAFANGVRLRVTHHDLTQAAPPAVDVILAGDVFYAPEVAAAVLPFLQAARRAGALVLIGDPGRKDLPPAGMVLVHETQARDVGAAVAATAAVWRLEG